jgi:hypothetical protein
MKRLAGAVAVAVLQVVASGSAMAADAIAAETPPYCDGHESIALNLEDNIATLKDEVGRLMDEAVAVSHDQHWIYSSRPVFVWANEAKYSCGKAYGYLKTSYRDEQNLNNCGCAYARMQSFMQ